MTDLQAFGVHRMDDEEIRGFLQSRGIGVLGLPTDGPPYLLPMSFGFDGEMTLYFTFVFDGDSEKQRLAERTDEAAFLVFDAPSQFTWESVQLSGTLSVVPESEWNRIDDILSQVWRPAVFENAVPDSDLAVYAFDIDERCGFKQTGLPPGYEEG